MSSTVTGIPTQHLRIAVNIDESVSVTVTVTPRPAICPGYTATEAIVAAETYTPLLRSDAARVATPEYCSARELVVNGNQQYLTLLEAIRVYHLGWQMIQKLHDGEYHGGNYFQCVELRLLMGRIMRNPVLDGTQKAFVVDKLLGDESVAWMREVLLAVASDPN